MAVVLVGEDPASKIYVRNKGKACAETGIYSEEHVLPENTTQEELLALIEKLNADPKINGILVQSPLPKHLNEALIVEHIDPKKDVDAFHAENVGRIMIGDFAFLPCTPAASSNSSALPASQSTAKTASSSAAATSSASRWLCCFCMKTAR